MKLILFWLVFLLDPKLWTLYGYNGWPKPITITSHQDKNGFLIFDFPSRPKALDQILTKQITTLPENHTLSFTYELVKTRGNPVFKYDVDPSNTCVSPAKVRFYMEQVGVYDGDPLKKWWSNPSSVELVSNSKVTLNVDIIASEWSSSFGRFGNEDAETYAAFQATLNNLNGVGLSFGGGCYFGHGVYVDSGSVDFKLLDFSVN